MLDQKLAARRRGLAIWHLNQRFGIQHLARLMQFAASLHSQWLNQPLRQGIHI